MMSIQYKDCTANVPFVLAWVFGPLEPIAGMSRLRSGVKRVLRPVFEIRP